MLKIETIEALKNTFNVETELSKLKVTAAPTVDVVSLDLIRVHINAEANAEIIAYKISEILKNNKEPGPLNLHAETAKSCNFIYYIDIISI